MNKGLVSVTFRSKSRGEIVSLAVRAGLSEIEWGGDIHVPHGDIRAAEDAARLCLDNALAARCYGSYYKLASDFAPVAAASSALGADSVRIWAGVKGSRDTDVITYSAMMDKLRRDADDAAALGLTLTFEYHPNTLTDNSASALRLLSDCGRDNVRLHWQPNQYKDADQNAAELCRVAPFVDFVHVFSWEGERRLPLSTHADDWKRYFDVLFTFGSPRAALLEFLPSETEFDLLRDAEALRIMTE